MRLVVVNQRVAAKVGPTEGARVTRDAAEVEEALREAVAQGPLERLVLVGGDGTLMAGLTAAVRVLGEDLPEVGLVAAGTVNTVARALGSKGSIAEQLARVREGGTVTQKRCLAVTADGETRHGFIWGTGLVSTFFDRYDREGGGVGVAAGLAARIAASALVGGKLGKAVLAPVPASITVDGAAPVEGRFSLAVTSVLRDVGLGIRVTYRADEDDGRLHFVASTASPSALARAFPRTFLGRSLGSAATIDALAREVRVRFPGGDGRYVLDGDSLPARAVTLSLGPRVRWVT